MTYGVSHTRGGWHRIVRRWIVRRGSGPNLIDQRTDQLAHDADLRLQINRVERWNMEEDRGHARLRSALERVVIHPLADESPCVGGDARLLSTTAAHVLYAVVHTLMRATILLRAGV